MLRILLLPIVVFILWYLWQESKKLKTLSPQQRRAKIWQTLFFSLFFITLFLVLTGRAHWLSAAIAGLLPALKSLLGVALRAAPILKLWSKIRGPAFSSVNIGPTLRSKYLEIKINLTNGLIEGVVRSGLYASTPLAELNLEQLNELLARYQSEDRESALLLRSYMTRRFNNFQNQETPASPTSSSEEAWQILGLKPGSTRDEIVKAHKRLMQKLHPDRGGSDYLAAKINAAKDQLLKNL